MLELRRFKHWQVPMYLYTALWEHPALLAGMRLGKCIVTIRRIKSYGEGMNLVVAPFSSIYDWTQDLLKENITDYCILMGNRKKRLKMLEEKHSWYILNTEGWKWIPEICEVPWNAVVFDEPTSIRNPKTKITKFFCKYFRNVPHRFILTGTPNPETDLDFFCPFLFLDSGETLGKNYYQFRAKYFKPDWFGNKWKATEKGHDFIINAVGQRSFMMQKEDIKGAKGYKEYKTLLLELPEDLRNTYTVAEEEFILEYGDTFMKSKHGVAKYNWLRQITSGIIDGRVVWLDKMEQLLSLLVGELKDEKVVVYSDFVPEIEAFYQLLTKYKIKSAILSGKVAKTERLNIIGNFAKGEYKVLIGQNLAVTFGTNLSSANTGIYLSRPLRSLIRRQTEERIIQVDKEEVSLILDVIVDNSVDMDIYESSRRKINDSQLTFDLAKRISHRINLKNTLEGV